MIPGMTAEQRADCERVVAETIEICKAKLERGRSSLPITVDDALTLVALAAVALGQPVGLPQQATEQEREHLALVLFTALREPADGPVSTHDLAVHLAEAVGRANFRWVGGKP